MATENSIVLLPARLRHQFNPLLRRLTGRITYGWKLIEFRCCTFATTACRTRWQTLEHEMLHLYLHALGLAVGTQRALQRDGAHARDSRLSHQPLSAKPIAPGIAISTSVRRAGGWCFASGLRDHGIACGVCCRQLAGGAWDPRFQLKLVEKVKLA